MTVKIDINDKIYGGRIYENAIVDSLKDSLDIKREFVMKRKNAVLNIFHFVFLLIKYNFFFKGTLLLTNSTTIFAGLRSRNIVVAHHIDSRIALSVTKLYEYFCDRYLFAHPKRFDTIIAVSEYWKKEFENNGLRNVRVIYNSFNPDEYVFSEESKAAFRRKYNLSGKPLVYLGNGRRGKGAEESYEALKGMDLNFVTSGISDISIPVKNLLLSNEEYRLLLASSDVVLTMSTFKEGWNRTAHEASLCGTPVIGSGIAGMGELLEIAGQTKIERFEDLPDAVSKAISRKYAPTEKLLSLNLDYFKEEWRKVLV